MRAVCFGPPPPRSPCSDGRRGRSRAAVPSRPTDWAQSPTALKAKIAAAIRRIGFNNPILVDDDNVIIAGHGRAASVELDPLYCDVIIRRLHEACGLSASGEYFSEREARLADSARAHRRGDSR